MIESHNIEILEDNLGFDYSCKGIIDKEDYFYFKASYGDASLEIFESQEDLDNSENAQGYVSLEVNIIPDEELAEKLINILYVTYLENL